MITCPSWSADVSATENRKSMVRSKAAARCAPDGAAAVVGRMVSITGSDASKAPDAACVYVSDAAPTER